MYAAFFAELLQHLGIAARSHRLGIGKTAATGIAVGLQFGQALFVIIDPQGRIFVCQGGVVHPDVFMNLEMSQFFRPDFSADSLYHNSILSILFCLTLS